MFVGIYKAVFAFLRQVPVLNDKAHNMTPGKPGAH
jgi:hypothetical protein